MSKLAYNSEANRKIHAASAELIARLRRELEIETDRAKHYRDQWQTEVAKNKELEKIVEHAWVHRGYAYNGYAQMTTGQKHLYCKVVGAQFDPLKPNF